MRNREGLRIAYVALPLLLGIALPARTYPQACGGTERWQVKVGTDPGAAGVELQAVVQKTLKSAISLSQPQIPTDNTTRLPEETHVYQVQGRLAQFKEETNDNDYHLIITDDTLQFTGDAARHGPGHSLIAEIPDPRCIPGQQGDPSVPSRFIAAITCTRGRMDARFPTADKTGAFNNTGGVPVTITGIGFFDRPHNQAGRASNNLEIHPLLNIDFGDGQPSCLEGAPAAADFTIAVVPPSLTILPGSSGTVSVVVTPVSGFTGSVSFSVSGVPPSVSSSVSPTPDGNAALVLSASQGAVAGASTLLVTGTSGSISHTTSLVLNVSAGAAGGAKWEYKVITASTADGLVQQANALGAEGWELAGVAFDTTRPDSYVGFMKRTIGP